MTAPVPETKFNDVLCRAMSLLGSWPVADDDLQLKRIEKEAIKLRSSGADISGAWEILGVCAAARNDIAGALDCARRIEGSPGADDCSALRIAFALSVVGANVEANEIAANVLHRKPNSVAAAKQASGIFANGGDLVRGARLHASTSAQRKDNGLSLDHVLSRSKFSQVDVEAPVKFARAFFRERRIPVICSGARLVGSDEPHFMQTFGINRDAEDVGTIESELFAALANENFKAEADGFVVFTVSTARQPIVDAG